MALVTPTRPKVNYVGAPPENTPQSPALDGAAFGRRKPIMVKMKSPEGVIEDVLPDNVRDFERLRNYHRVLVRKPKVDVETDADAETDGKAGETGGITDPSLVAAQSKLDEQAAAMKYLETLRETLTKAGVEVDKRWGLARLRREIADRALAVPENTTDDLDEPDASKDEAPDASKDKAPAA